MTLEPSPTPPPGAPHDELAGALGPGVVLLGPGANVRFADPRALELMGCEDGFELERVWAELKPRLESAGLRWDGAGGGAPMAALDLPVPAAVPGGTAGAGGKGGGPPGPPALRPAAGPPG